MILDASCIKAGDVADLVQERAGIALSNGADGVIASPQEAALIRALPEAEGKLIVTPRVCAQQVRPWRPKAGHDTCASDCEWRRPCGCWTPDLASSQPKGCCTRHFG